jgi:cytochrome c biogenesis factor
LLMALGGLLSLTDRRFRVAAGEKGRTQTKAGKQVPAE